MKKKPPKCPQCGQRKPRTKEHWVIGEDNGNLHLQNCRECIEANTHSLNKNVRTLASFVAIETAHKRIGQKQHTPLPGDRSKMQKQPKHVIPLDAYVRERDKLDDTRWIFHKCQPAIGDQNAYVLTYRQVRKGARRICSVSIHEAREILSGVEV